MVVNWHNHPTSRTWQLPEGYKGSLKPVVLLLGKESPPLEVVVASDTKKPTKTDMRDLWQRRHQNRPATMLLVAEYPTSSETKQVIVCGKPSAHLTEGDDTTLVVSEPLDPAQVERFTDRALEEDRHRATEMTGDFMDQIEKRWDGYRNRGLIANHVLDQALQDKPILDFWSAQHPEFAQYSGKELISALGYEISDKQNGTQFLYPQGPSPVAVAVFLDRDEHYDRPSHNHLNTSPVSNAMRVADQEGLSFVVMVKESTLRIYLSTLDRGLRRGGRNNTFLEVDLNIIRPELLGMVPMLFGASSLKPEADPAPEPASADRFPPGKGPPKKAPPAAPPGDGDPPRGYSNIHELLNDSGRFASELGKELRQRVYDQVLPGLADLVAQDFTPVEGEPREGLDRLFQTAMTILFRLLFVAYAEDQDLLSYEWNELYRSQSLKSLAEYLAGRASEKKTTDVEFDSQSDSYWTRLLTLWKTIHEGDDDLGIPFYNGGMFSSGPKTDEDPYPTGEELSPSTENTNQDPGPAPDKAGREESIGADIAGMKVTNAQIGPVLMALLVAELPHGGYGPVDFRQLDAEEFGTIYEGLLEWELVKADTALTRNQKGVYISAKPGQEVMQEKGSVFLVKQSGIRKTTGTYFTPSFAVEHLLDKALEPAIADHLDRVKALLSKDEQNSAAEAFFDFKVADIAMGSGHFLVAAIDRIEVGFSGFLDKHPLPGVQLELDYLANTAKKELGDLKVHYEIDRPALLRRMIARHCIFGVDINPLAVDLARFAVWLKTFVPGLPLSYLDHTLICGDSLIGIGTPEEAEKALIQSKAKKKDKKASTSIEPEKKGEKQDEQPSPVQMPLTAPLFLDWLKKARGDLFKLAQLNDSTKLEIEQAKKLEEQVQQKVRPFKELCNILVAQRLDGFPQIEDISDDLIDKYSHREQANELMEDLNPVHFPVAFPEVFLRDRPGFDCILGNPPWEKVQFETESWWNIRFPNIKTLSKEEKKKRREEILLSDTLLSKELSEEITRIDTLSALIKSSNYIPEDVSASDLFKAFSWRFLQLLDEQGGQLGVVLPNSSLVSMTSTAWRKVVVEDGGFTTVSRLQNKSGWFHNEIGGNLVIGLISLIKGQQELPILNSGPFSSVQDYESPGGGGGESLRRCGIDSGRTRRME